MQYKAVHWLGGTASICIPFEMPSGTALVPVVSYVDDQTGLTFIRARYENGCIAFETDHFSTFVLALVDTYSGNIGTASFTYDTVHGLIKLLEMPEEGTASASFYDETGRFIGIKEMSAANTAIPAGTDTLKLFIFSDAFAPMSANILLYAS